MHTFELTHPVKKSWRHVLCEMKLDYKRWTSVILELVKNFNQILTD